MTKPYDSYHLPLLGMIREANTLRQKEWANSEPNCGLRQNLRQGSLHREHPLRLDKLRP